jgi:hypothetical protein
MVARDGGADLKRAGFGCPAVSRLSPVLPRTGTAHRSTMVKLEKWRDQMDGWAQGNFMTAEECAMFFLSRR